MFLDSMLNQGSAPLLERMVRFTSARHEVIAQNIVNADTPGYVQQDLSLPAFQKALSERIEAREKAPRGSVGFDDLMADVRNPKSGMLFHDRNNRTMEQLMSDMASNGMRHNMYTEMLKKSYEQFATVLKDRVA